MRSTLLSLLSLATIFCGVRYAYGRERLRSPEHLYAIYQNVNKGYFDGNLPDAVLTVADLSADNAIGVAYVKNDKFLIAVDASWNRSESEALDTIKHEACHVSHFQEPGHGPLWQDCMRRFDK